ncbi:MAG: amidohydrolase family protein [Candidatus Bathyarchaeia archaeon]
MVSVKELATLDRRRFLKYAGAGVAVAGTAALGLAGYSLREQSSPISQRTSSTIASSSVMTPARRSTTASVYKPNKVIDTNSHLMPGLEADKLLSIIDRAGVQRTVLFPRHGSNDSDTLSVYNKYPERILPYIGFQNKDWLTQKSIFIPYIENQLKSGKFAGLGEVLLRHYAVPTRDAEDYNIPANGEIALQVFAIAANHDIPVTVHLEAEKVTIPQFEEAMQKNPKTHFVWVAEGRADFVTLKRLLNTYSNLYCDIAGMDTLRSYGLEKNPIIDVNTGKPFQEWADIFVANYNRFLFGTNTVFLDQFDMYADFVNFHVNLMNQIDGNTNDMINAYFYDNATKLLSTYLNK